MIIIFELFGLIIMFQLFPQTPQQSLNAEIIRFRPNESDFNRFKQALNNLLGQIDEADRENRQEIYVRDFLLESFYRDRSQINKKGDVDLAIHTGKTKESSVAVIIEAKRPAGGEMISAANPNAKALQQAVLYFMRERVDEGNLDLKYIVVTNIKEWFIFKAADFNRYFHDDARFRRDYEEWRDKVKVAQKTKDFYAEIAKPALDKLELVCTHFKLEDYAAADEKELIALYKIFSPFYLLKESLATDSNRLDRNFYNELLHIIGLEETKEKNKTLIKRKPANKRDSGSLLEKAIDKIESKYSRFDQKKMLEMGADKDDRVFNVALELCIVWINRILFLKLLESQLVAYHENNAEFRFLNVGKINNFGELYVLFHDVLNKIVPDRSPHVAEKYSFIPYLNSSLFDFAEVENLTIAIDELDNNIELTLQASSILRKIGEDATELPTLEYLFRFLDAYDFASEGKEGVQPENRSLINASVLGKVFEKINGYKDGSFYTPGFITMYMCRQAIRAAVVQKFKERYELDIETFDDLYTFVSRFNRTEKTLEFNGVIDELKICDPAVGSGHFLVSALNEILAIKSELGIFADGAGKPFNQYRIAVANDEIIVTDRDNKPFRYIIRGGRPLTDEMQRLQETLFHEKQTIIENCLFGVDINPNSVKICRLRLWIELLKNAYYKKTSEPEALATGLNADKKPVADAPGSDLETLPNIDINIKQGNSLVSRFQLKDKFRSPRINQWIKEFSQSVNKYKNEKNRDEKDVLNARIKNFHMAFSGLLEDETTKLKKQLDKKIYALQENQNPLFTARSEVEKEIAERNLKGEIAKIEKQIAEIETKYKNAFEWRFEFPEVLNHEGDFTGFDAVIGNPPYIRQEELGTLKNHLRQRYAVFAGTADLLVYFYELGLNVLKPNGSFSFITSNKFMRAGYGKSLRGFLAQYSLENIIDFGDAPVFDEAIAYPLILNLKKCDASPEHQTRVYTYPQVGDISEFETGYNERGFIVAQKELTADGWRLEQTDVLNLLAKLRSKGTPLGEYVNGRFYYGIKTGLNEAYVVDRETRDRLIAEDAKSAEILKPFLRGRDVKRWNVHFEDLYLIKIESSSNKIHAWSGKKKLEAEQIFAETYPAIYNRFQNFREQLINRDDQGMYFWELRACIYWHEFEQPKIILPAIENKCAFAIDESGFYGNDKTNICIADEPQLVAAILNSSVSWWIIRQTASEKQNAYYEFKPMYVSQIPIPASTDEQKRAIENLVDQILELKKQGGDTTGLEADIDRMVFDLYELNAEERRIVSGEA